MVDKLIIKSTLQPGSDAIDSQVEICIDSYGQLHKLTRVKQLTLYLDADEPPHAALTVYTNGLATEVDIDKYTAEAVIRACASRDLAFLDDNEAAALRDLRHGLQADAEKGGQVGMWSGASGHILVLDKILAELARREEIPF